MTSITNHKKKIKEHLDVLREAIEIDINSRPSNIGFNAVACATNLLELYLHKKKLIDIGKTVKHSWFKRPKEGQKVEPLIERNLPVNFDNKDEVYNLIYSLEEHRDLLIYGSPSKQEVESVLEKFNKLKRLLFKMIEEDGEQIE